jgi:hypothetical protein
VKIQEKLSKLRVSTSSSGHCSTKAPRPPKLRPIDAFARVRGALDVARRPQLISWSSGA